MPILMEHKKHGLHHVYSEADAVTHEKIGWKRVIKDVIPEVKEEIKKEVKAPIKAKKKGK